MTLRQIQLVRTKFGTTAPNIKHVKFEESIYFEYHKTIKMLVEQQPPIENRAPIQGRDLVVNPSTQGSSEEGDENITDTRIYQFEENTSERYPRFLRRSDEVKAENGFIWCRCDANREENFLKCSYSVPVPTRGNCVMCGRSGALGLECSNRCVYDKMTRRVIRSQARARDQHDNYRDDPDLDIRRNARSKYRIMMTPEKENMIDAEFFAELMYKGVDDDQRNWNYFDRKPSSFKKKRHDGVSARLERLENPWVYTFPLDPSCEWYQQLEFLSGDLNLENPLPDQRYSLD